MLGVPFHFWVLGVGTPVPHMSQMQGTCRKNLCLTRSPTNEARSFILRKPPAKTVSGQGWARSIVVSAAGSRKPLYSWHKAPQCGMNQIPPASIRLHYSWIIIPKCTLMLKKSLLQNFKATIKYSIVMAQLNGLA